MKIATIVAVIGVILTTGVADAASNTSTVSGNAFLEGCRAFSLQNANTSYFDQGVCVGIMHAVSMSQAGVKEKFRSCPPPGSTLGQYAAVTVAFIDRHPERRHELLLNLAVDAFHEVWPCNK